MYVHFSYRHSVPDLEGCLAKLHPLITTLRERARESCHRANQLLLLRDMLETRQCSHLLLPESLSEAWVENVVHKRVYTDHAYCKSGNLVYSVKLYFT